MNAQQQITGTAIIKQIVKVLEQAITGALAVAVEPAGALIMTAAAVQAVK